MAKKKRLSNGTNGIRMFHLVCSLFSFFLLSFYFLSVESDNLSLLCVYLFPNVVNHRYFYRRLENNYHMAGDGRVS